MERRNTLLAIIAILTFPIIEGKVAPRPLASIIATAAERLVELPRNHDAPSTATTEEGISTTRYDDILPPSSITSANKNIPRNLVIDGTSNEARSDDAHLHSKFHEKLETLYSGDIPSSSVEFTLRNSRSDGRYAIISGLGLHVKQIRENAEGDNDGDTSEPPPCRIKIYTKRSVAGTSNIEMNTVTAESAMYSLALDAHVLCKDEGEETLLNSDLFLRSYREVFQGLYDEGDDDGNGGSRRRTLVNVEDSLSGLGASTDSQRSKEEMYYDTENVDEGAKVGENEAPSFAVSGGGGAYASQGLTEDEKNFPLLLLPDVSLSVYVMVLPVPKMTPEDITFQILSSNGDASPDRVEGGGEDEKTRVGDVYSFDSSLDLSFGSSVVEGFLINPDPDSSTQVQLQEPTVFNGAIYYDLFNPHHTSLLEYNDALQYSLLPGDALHGCDKEFSTGFIDTVGSYGFMFDVSSNVEPTEDGPADGDDEEFLKRFRNVEIYGMDLYIRNPVNASFEIYVRTGTIDAVDGGAAVASTNVATTTTIAKKRTTYASYQHLAGQTLISKNWEMIASGIVEGKGPDVGSPIPHDAWKKNIVVPPGETVGFYVTVKDDPHLRYRNTTLPEGSIYKSDGILNFAVGRSWGGYPLRGDGMDVYFSPREFSGAFRYHVHEGLCYSESPSVAPSAITYSPTRSHAPTDETKHTYLEVAEEKGLCPEENTLETTFKDGTGSFGGLFDMMAKTDLTLMGIDLNMDWNTGNTAHVFIYARKGSWFGHQNNATSWTHLLVNTTIHRPLDFHNRSEDGQYIPIPVKRESAIVPRNKFTPLEMKVDETWALYICSSLADFRYTLGTSIGKTFASNSELRIMEGAGAADYPPFLGGTPEGGGVEYTFYAPRVFNGQLRYDYVSECPSESPSSALTVTPAPTVMPTLTTTVSYTFYVEHEVKSKSTVEQDMESGVRDVLDGFLGGNEDILHGHKTKDELVIERVVANMVSPAEIGYLCYTTPPMICTPISVDVSVTHRATATKDEITYALLRQSTHLPTLINVEGYTMEYVGDRAVETKTGITLVGVPDREMTDSELKLFVKGVKGFLDNMVLAPGFLDHMVLAPHATGNDSLRILIVTVNGQEITSSVSNPMEDAADSSPTLTSMQIQNNGARRLKKSNKIKVSVKGKYRPPPEVDFGEVITSSINRDRELLTKELKDRHPVPGAALNAVDNSTYSDYFAEAEVVGARQIKDDKGGPESLAARNHQIEEDSMKGVLNLAAMAVGGLIVLLSFAFLLRPHRRRALFSSKYKDRRAHRSTAQVDADDGDRFLARGNSLRRSTKNRAMIRGESLGDSGNSFPNVGSDQATFNLHGSNTSEGFSDFSANGGGPNSSQGFDPRASGAPLRNSGNRGSNHPMNGSFTSGGPLNGSFTRGPLNGSFAMPQELPQGPYGSGPGPGRNNSVPPRRHHGPPEGGGHFSMNNSMPPMRGGPGGPGPGGHMSRSMTSQSRGGGRGRGRRPTGESMQSKSFQSGPPPDYRRRQSPESMNSSFQSGPMGRGGGPPPRGMHPGMGGAHGYH